MHFQAAFSKTVYFYLLPGTPLALALAPLQFPFRSQATSREKTSMSPSNWPDFSRWYHCWVMTAGFLAVFCWRVLSRPEGRSGTRGMLSLLSTFTRLCAMISAPGMTLTVQRSTVMSWVNWGRKYCKKNLNFCATVPQWPKVLWGKKTQSSFATSCTSQICLCAISFFFPETKIKLKNDHFDTVKGFQGSVK